MKTSDVRIAISRMEDDVSATVNLLHAISVIAAHGSQPKTALEAEECEGLLQVVLLTLRHAVDVKDAWKSAFEMTRTI